MNHYIKLATATTLWGTVGIFVLWSGLDSVMIAFFRCIIGAALMLTLNQSILSDFKKYSIEIFALWVFADCLLLLIG